MKIVYQARKDNGRTNTLSQRPDLISDTTTPENPPREIDNDGSLKPTTFVFNAFINIIKNL